MTGIRELELINRVRSNACKAGLKVEPDLHGLCLNLVPNKDNLPFYRREAIIKQGSFEDLDAWLEGVLWSREYDDHVSHNQKDKKTSKIARLRQRCEQDIRNRLLMAKLADKDVDDILF
jgi:hypothetical protein